MQNFPYQFLVICPSGMNIRGSNTLDHQEIVIWCEECYVNTKS